MMKVLYRVSSYLIRILSVLLFILGLFLVYVQFRKIVVGEFLVDTISYRSFITTLIKGLAFLFFSFSFVTVFLSTLTPYKEKLKLASFTYLLVAMIIPILSLTFMEYYFALPLFALCLIIFLLHVYTYKRKP
jgi:hypothetical protein